MIIYDIAQRKKKELSFLGKSKQNVELIDTLLTELKKHSVGVTELSGVKERIENPYLEKKIEDIITIYEEYNKLLEGKYIEENDKLEILANQIDKTDLFNDCIFYIDEFTGFTKQEYEIIAKLMKIAYQVNITITTDNLDMGQETISQDLFYSNKQTADKLLYIARTNQIECDKTVFLNTSYRFENEELAHLEQNIENYPYKEYKNEINNISVLLAQNPYSEVENIAKEIVKLIKKGYRYKDIVVITKELNIYGSLCKAIFNSYNIPIFIDEKKELSQNLFAKYVLALLEVYSSNWSYEAVIGYLKSGFIDIEDEWIYELENSARKLGIKGNKWYKDEWKVWQDEEKLQYLNKIREEKLMPLVDLKEKFSKDKTIESMNTNLYNFLLENRIQEQIKTKQEKLEKKGNLELAKEQELAWNILISILDEMSTIFENKKMSFNQYRELLKIALTENGLGEIPQTQDEVIIGDVTRTKFQEVKAIFILGVNDGVFPGIRKDEGFLNDSDRVILKNYNVELAKGSIENLYEERFLIYKVFATAREKLYISYCSSDNESKALRPSIYVTKLKKIFPKLTEKSDINEEFEIINEANTFEELINNLRKEHEGEKIESKWYAIERYFAENDKWKGKLEQAKKALYLKEQVDRISDENIKKLYGNKLETSVSRMEQYRSCPFSYHLKYGLNLKEQEEYKIKSLDTGTFMHETIDDFFNIIRERQIDINEIEDSELYKIIEEIINEKLGLPKYYVLTSNEKFNILTNKLKRVVLQSMKFLIEGLKKSDFKVMANELEFKNGKEYKPIILDLEDGKKVEITGKIDRIDIAKVDNKNYIRIIDYKSYVTNIDLNEVVAGLQIQLLTYLDATCKIENMMPAGMLYYNLIDPVINSNKPYSKEQLEEELRKKFKMNGLILADINIVKMMDKTLENGSSNIVPAYIDSKGNLSSSRSSTINEEQFERLMNHTKKIIKQISKEILDGNIEIKPYYQRKTKTSACDRCAYGAICGFKQSNLPYMYVENDSKEAVLEKIKEG